MKILLLISIPTIIVLQIIVYVAVTDDQLPFVIISPNERIPVKALDSWVANHDLALVLYCNEVNLAGDAVAVVDRFEKAGTQLNGYNIHFGVYDCRQDPTHERCTAQQSHAVISSYLKGTYMMDIPMDSLYDELSILSNALELLLLHEVPLIQTSEELTEQMQYSMNMSSDFLIAVVKAIGTVEHAHYMKLAKESLDTDGIQLTFTYSTTNSFISHFTGNAATRKLAEELRLSEDDAQLYYVKCSGVMSAEGAQCPIYQYMGRFDLGGLSNYVQLLTFTGERAEAVDRKLPTITCFYGNGDELTQVNILTRWMSEELKGAMLVYTLPSKEASEEETNLQKEMGSVCTIKDEILGLEAIIKLQSVQSYIIEHVLVKRRELSDLQEEDDSIDQTDEDAEVDAIITSVETVDDSLDKVDHGLGGVKILDLSNLVVLDRTSFNYKSFSGIVLFHLMKYDHRSRIVLRLYNEAAANLTKGSLSIIDCYDWTDVCKKLNITEFPTIRLYKKGKYHTYNGPQSIPAFINMFRTATFDSPHTVSSMQDVMSVRKNLIKANVTLIVVGLFDSNKCKEYIAYKQVSTNLHGQFVMLVATDKKLAETVKKQFQLDSLPVIAMYNVSVKDMSNAITKFDKKTFNSKTIRSFILRSTLPSFVELTPSSLPLVQISRQPQVLFFTEELQDKTFKTIQTLSSDNSLKNKFGFNYLPLLKSVNQRILRSLSGRVKSPTLLVCDYNKGKVFHYEADVDVSFNVKDIKSWLQQLSIGNILATRDIPEGQWKGTHPGYDFLELIEKDKKKQKVEHDRLNILSHSEQDTDSTSEPSDVVHSSSGTDSTDYAALEHPTSETPASDGASPRHTEL